MKKPSRLSLVLAFAACVFSCGDDGTVLEEPASQIGFEILERLPNGNLKAWISPDITREAFDALELPSNFFKNQPREGGGTEAGGISNRFLRSPDAVLDGEFAVEELFGFQWFHAATVVQIGVPIGGDGLLTAVRVRKYHEYTVDAGSPILLLVSPEGDAYFRNGRDATRTVDDPTIPDSWRLVEYTPAETLIIELFDGNLVIRTDNQDSFQGPVPSLQGRL